MNITTPSNMPPPAPRKTAVQDHDVEAQPISSSSSRTSEEMYLQWRDLSVTVKDSKTKQAVKILEDVTGGARPGDLVALMGPSGAGKTTLLNVLAQRSRGAGVQVAGQVYLDRREVDTAMLRELSTYVEQEDALIGSLTVRETIEFAARLSPHAVQQGRIDELVRSFGLKKQEHARIGTPVAKGISGGQKRRVSVASQLVTRPRILFLDEPTSGLDSKAAYEVMRRVQQVAREENMIVISSIHQPSTATFNLFSQLVLLTHGRVVYSGDRAGVVPYFASQSLPVPALTNPAEHLLDVCNDDFGHMGQDEDEDGDGQPMNPQISRLIKAWAERKQAEGGGGGGGGGGGVEAVQPAEREHTGLARGHYYPQNNVLKQTVVLIQRLWLKSYRDLLAYWIRVIMYLGLAFMMGTVWLRLGLTQDNIQPFINAIFFSGAFMSFMAVAYIPAYLEDQQSYRKERANGLYGPTAFLLSNFIIGVPFMFLITLLFAIVTVFLVNFRHDATSFFRYVMWLFLDLLAAESLVVLVSSLVPIFVAALAITAFANGLWMSVGGFLVTQRVLNTFWYHTFYWIDYQRYVFQGMMFNEFEDRVYACADGCQCMYPSPLADECKIAGDSVLMSIGYSKRQDGLWVGILVAIIVAMRLLAWLTLKLKKN